MRRHMGAVGEQRHGVIGKAADDLHHHEHCRDDGGPFGACLGPGMALAQKDMVAGPDAVIVILMGMVVAVIMTVIMFMIVVMSMRVPMRGQSVIVRHKTQLSVF